MTSLFFPRALVGPLLFLSLGTSACFGVPTTAEDGPVVTAVELSTPAGSASGPSDSLKPESDGQPYVIRLRVSVSAGTDTADDDRQFAAEKLDLTVAMAGSSLPPLGLLNKTPEESGRTTFEAPQPLTIPASAKGKYISVRAVATDGRGLRSNIVAFQVRLD